MDDNNQVQLRHRESGMLSLAAEHAGIARLLPSGRAVAYLDYALTTNVGDQLIVLGTLAFFKKYGIKRRFSRNISNSEPMGKLPLHHDDIIVLHGGGNFGDIYPHFQRYREAVINHYRDHRIIMLPQTVHFSEPDALARASERMNRHPDLSLFVRDTLSLGLMRPYFGERVQLMPDMAHQLWPSLLSGCEGVPVSSRSLLLMRTDVERGNIPAPFADFSNQFTDWDNIVSRIFRVNKRLVTPLSRIGLLRSCRVDIDEFYFKALQSEVRRVSRLLYQCSHWTTSRLHGAILGLLLAKPIIAIDNSYGKISSYLDTWHERLSPTVIVKTDAQARLAASYAQFCQQVPGGGAWPAYEALSRGEPWKL